MKFTEVAPMMEKGAKIKLKQWKNAYWYLDNKGCLINHFEEVKKFYQNEKRDTVTINPHIDMKAADGTYVTGWIASQTDMLADDWYVVE